MGSRYCWADGEKTEQGFVLNEPNIQTFEKKPKESKETAPPVATPAGQAAKIIRGKI